MWPFGSIIFINGSAYCEAEERVIVGRNYQNERVWSFGTYFGETCGEDTDFKIFGHLFQEVLSAGTFHDIDIRDTAFDIDWDCIVWASDLVELTVD